MEVTRQDGSVLNFAFPILKEAKYQQSIFSSWDEDGIHIERYADSLVLIKNAKVKYKAIIYCLEHNILVPVVAGVLEDKKQAVSLSL